MKNIFFTFIVIFALSSACSKNSNSFYNLDRMIVLQTNNIDDTLCGELVEFDSLINPSGIEAIDSFVVILSGQSGKLFSVYNSNSNMLVSQFGRIGHAKNEFIDELSTCQFSYDKRNGKVDLSVQSYERNELRVFDFSKALAERELKLCNNIKYDCNDLGLRDHFAFYCDENGYVVYKSISTEGDIRDKLNVPPVICVKNGHKDAKINIFPKTVESSCRDFVEILYFCFPRMKADGTKLVNVFSFTDLISITDLNTLETTGISCVDGRDFDFYQNIAYKSREELFDNIVIQNSCYNISDNYIVVCQDHKTKIDDFETMQSYDTIIRIMDWDGNLLHTFKVKEPLMRIAFTECSKKLYGFDLEKKLYCYDLSKIL